MAVSGRTNVRLLGVRVCTADLAPGEIVVLKIYRYTFYRLYRWSQATHAPYEAHKYYGLLYLSAAMIMNIVALAVLLQAFLNFQTPGLVKANQALVGGGLAVLILGINYAILGRVYGLEKIIGEFEDESEDQARRGDVAVKAYFILSPLFLIGLFFLVAMLA